MLNIEAKMYRCTYDNQRLSDISDGVISATVTMDPGRDVTWTLDAEVTWDAWKTIRPYKDWVAPVMTVTYPDGSQRSGQLGLYLVLDSPEMHDDLGATVRLEAMDVLWLLAAQGLGNRYTAKANTRKMAAVKDLLNDAVLTETGRGKNLYHLPNVQEDFKRAAEWPSKTPRLQVINEILGGAGCYPLWATRTGRITTRERGLERLKDRAPVRTYFANVPPGVRVRGGANAPGGLSGEVVGQIEVIPQQIDITNEVVILNDDAEPDDPSPGEKDPSRPGKPDKRKRGARGRHQISHPKNKRSKDVEQRRRKRKTRHQPTLDNDATAGRVARSLAEELSAQSVMVRMGVLPDPSIDFTHETVALAIWNETGWTVALGQYKVQSVTYGFTPADAVMQLQLGRIDDADAVLVDQ